MLLAATLLKLCLSRREVPPFPADGLVLRECEEFYAAGTLFPFKLADQYCLELIPGISSVLAVELLQDRAAILRKAQRSEPGAAWSALEVAHGIGRVKALEFSEYLCLTSACELPDRGLPGASSQPLPSATPE